MNIKRIAKFAGIAAAVPVLLMANSGAAFADGGPFHWQNRGAGSHCLASYWSTETVSMHVNMVPYSSILHCTSPEDTNWYDKQGNLENPNGAWTENPGTNQSYCLTSYWQPDSNTPAPVYLEPCSSPANYYEQWYENWDASMNGFRLVNRETGLCLDGTNADDTVYALPCRQGDSNQAWY